jgi:hypothetical protein
MADLDRLARPRRHGRIGREDQQHRRAIELGAQGGRIDRPGPTLVAIGVELNLDDHAGDGLVVVALDDRDGVGIVARGCDAGEIDRAEVDARMIELDSGAGPQ